MVPKNKIKNLKKEGEKKSEREKRKQGSRAVKETCTENKSSSGISWNNYKINLFQNFKTQRFVHLSRHCHVSRIPLPKKTNLKFD